MKEIIGMVHLKALPTSANSTLSINDIYEFAKADLESLIEGGATSAIVENMFDIPYSTNPSLEIYAAFTSIYSRLKEISSIPLGINIQAVSGSEEMVIASICGSPFIRVENLVEERVSSFGRLYPSGPLITRKKKDLKSQVEIYADINSKHTYAVSDQPISESIEAAIASHATKIILTGSLTGKPPTLEEAKEFKKYCKDIPLLIGSGITKENLKEFLEVAEGVIVGSSIKKDGKIDSPVDSTALKELIKQL